MSCLHGSLDSVQRGGTLRSSEGPLCSSGDRLHGSGRSQGSPAQGGAPPFYIPEKCTVKGVAGNVVLGFTEPPLMQQEDQGVWSLTDPLKIPALLLSSCGTVTSILEPQLGCSQYVLQKPGAPATHSLGGTVVTPPVI